MSDELLTESDARRQRLERENSMLRCSIEELQASRSWRITAPLRWIGQKIRSLRVASARATVSALFAP